MKTNYGIDIKKFMRVDTNTDLSKTIILPNTVLGYTEFEEYQLKVNTLDTLQFNQEPDLGSLLPFIVSQLVVDCNLETEEARQKFVETNKVDIYRLSKNELNIEINFSSEIDSKIKYKTNLYKVLVSKFETFDNFNSRGAFNNDNMNSFRGKDSCGYDAGSNSANGTARSFSSMTFGEIINTAQSKLTECAEKVEHSLNEGLNKVQEQLNNRQNTENSNTCSSTDYTNSTNTSDNINVSREVNLDGLGAVSPGSNLNETLKEVHECNNSCSECICEKESNNINLIK